MSSTLMGIECYQNDEKSMPTLVRILITTKEEEVTVFARLRSFGRLSYRKAIWDK